MNKNEAIQRAAQKIEQAFDKLPPTFYRPPIGYFQRILQELVDSVRGESAWEMFNRLTLSYGDRYYELLCKHFEVRFTLSYINVYKAIGELLNKDEQKAIEIMRQIEKELNAEGL